MAFFVIHSLHPLSSQPIGSASYTDLRSESANSQFLPFFRIFKNVYFKYKCDISVIPCMFKMYDLKMQRKVLINRSGRLLTAYR